MKDLQTKETKKRLNAEWIPYMKAYRLYEPQHPQQTVAYVDDLDSAEISAKDNGYDDIVLCDIDTMCI